MVNILKDAVGDLDRGDCFLPSALALECGVKIEDLRQPESRPGALRLVHLVAQRARLHLAHAERYTLGWPGPDGASIRLFCAVPLCLAYATLDEIEKGDSTLVPGMEPKVSREAVAALLLRAQEAISDQSALTGMLESYRRGNG
jgi:farnesyl-diphosphate farnesyltransferase